MKYQGLIASQLTMRSLCRPRYQQPARGWKYPGRTTKSCWDRKISNLGDRISEVEDVLELTLWPSRAALWSRYRLQNPVSEHVLNLDRSTAWQKVKTNNAKMRRMDLIGDKRNFKPLRRKFCYLLSLFTKKYSNSDCYERRVNLPPNRYTRFSESCSKSSKTPLNSKLLLDLIWDTDNIQIEITKHRDIPAVCIYISGQYGQYGVRKRSQ